MFCAASWEEDEGKKPDASARRGDVVYVMRWDYSKKYLATAGHNAVVHVWRRAAPVSGLVFEREPVDSFVGHVDDVISLDWSVTGHLVSASLDHSAIAWATQDSCQEYSKNKDSESRMIAKMEHPDVVTAAVWHQTSVQHTQVITACVDYALRVWNVDIENNKAELVRCVQSLFQSTCLSLTPDMSSLVAGTADGQCVFYDAKTLEESKKWPIAGFRGKRSREEKRKVTGMTVREDSPELLLTSNDGRIYLFDLSTGKLCFKLKGFLINRLIRLAASFSQDSSAVICPSEDRYVCFWNTTQTISTKEVPLPSSSRSLEADKFRGLLHFNHSLCDKMLCFFEISSFSICLCFYDTASTKEVACAVFVPRAYAGDNDTRFFVVGDARGNLTVFENPLVQ